MTSKMQRTLTPNMSPVAPCRGRALMATAACRSLPLRSATPAPLRSCPLCPQQLTFVSGTASGATTTTQPALSCSCGLAAAPTARRGRSACAAYSRSSWRTAILSEEEPSLAAAAAAQDNDSSPQPALSAARPPAGEDDEGDDAAGGGTLTATELRVKLSLAASSGRLDLTDCRLRRLPPEVLELTELEELQLSGNRLMQLPDQISRLTGLRRLGLAGNQLAALPPGLGALTALEGLWLHGNLLARLPLQLGGLGALRALSLAGNCLEDVPAGSLAGLTSLTDLTLAGNRLTALPPRELAPLVRLRKLALNGNQLGSCSAGGGPAAGGLGLGAHSTALTELMLQGNHLESVDPAIFECPALTELSLADNRLTALPSALSAASSLARLHLFGNALPALGPRQLAALPALTSCWLEGNPLTGEAVSELLAMVRSGAVPRLKALGLDQAQLSAAAAVAAQCNSARSSSGGDSNSLPPAVRVGCVLGSGPGYFKLQYGPQRIATAGVGGTGSSSWDFSCDSGVRAGAGDPRRIRSSNELLVVAFGSAPGTPNWGGLLGKVYRAAAAGEGRYFDVLYVADPARDWYGGGDDSVYGYYRERLLSYTQQYRRVLLLGDSMGATAALLFSDLATGALAFCPQVDLTAASIRPGRPAAWLDRLRGRLEEAVQASRGELAVLVGTWQHDLGQANLLPQAGSRAAASGDGRTEDTKAAGFGNRGSTLRSWREAAGGAKASDEEAARARAVVVPSPPQVAAGAAAQRKPWAWEELAAEGRSSPRGESVVKAHAAGLATQADGDGPLNGGDGVRVKVFSVDSHRLAAALDARGQLVPLILDAILHQLGLRSGNVRFSNLL